MVGQVDPGTRGRAEACACVLDVHTFNNLVSHALALPLLPVLPLWWRYKSKTPAQDLALFSGSMAHHQHDPTGLVLYMYAYVSISMQVGRRGSGPQNALRPFELRIGLVLRKPTFAYFWLERCEPNQTKPSPAISFVAAIAVLTP